MEITPKQKIKLCDELPADAENWIPGIGCDPGMRNVIGYVR